MIDKYNEVGISALEHMSNVTAKPAGECIYPRCEDCDKYHGHWCTVPMVISKQNFIFAERKLQSLEARLDDLENLVTDEILGSER